MSNQQGWSSGAYGSYQGYNQALPNQTYDHTRETQYPPLRQPPIPQQSRHEVQQQSHFPSASPLAHQPVHAQYYPPPVPQYGQAFQAPYQTHTVPQYPARVGQTAHLQPQYYQPQVRQTQPSQGFQQPGYSYSQNKSTPLSQPHQRGAQSYVQPKHSSAPQQASQQHHSSSMRSAPATNPIRQISHTSQSRPSQQATPQQRTVAHVSIPVYRPPSIPVESPMPRTTKRRRSNEGHAVPVCAAPTQPKPVTQQQLEKKPAVASSSPLTDLASSQLPTTPQTDVDYQAVLLQLSDEYIAEAYNISAHLVSDDRNDEQLERYQSLMAMGMGCLESTLNTYRRLEPRKEARIRLRLASLLHEETENLDAAEEILSKGISLCERSKLADLKYAMQHLLARISFDRSSKVAFKSVDKLIADTEALKLVHWTYAFRFLRIALTFRKGGSDTAVLLKHLTAIASSAENGRHKAVHIVAATLEALVHLRSGSADASDLAQRALAAARTYQLDPAMQKLPQICAMLEYLDLACGFLHFSPEQMAAKLQQMHATFDKTSKIAGWNKNGTFALPLGFATTNDSIEADTAPIFETTTDTGVALLLQWLNASQIYELGYVLSGCAMMYKSSDNSKAVTCLHQGMKMLERNSANVDQSLQAAACRARDQTSLVVYARIQLAFAHCNSSDWKAVSAVLHEIQQVLDNTVKVDETVSAIVSYLSAMCKHAAGEFEAALSLYSTPALIFRTDEKHNNALRDIQALACLSSIVILRASKDKGRRSEANDMMGAVEAYCLTHHEQAFVAAWHTLKATSEADMPIIRTKQSLQSAVKAARASFNQRLLCVIMNTMTQMYFRGVVGDQAEKSARAGRSLALKTKDKLWLAVADGMFAHTSELCGKNGDAKVARDEAEGIMAGLREKIKTQLDNGIDA